MELIQRVQNFKRNLVESDDPSAPWYRRKQILLCGGIFAVILIGALLFIIGFTGVPNSKTDSPTAEPRVILPLQWEGVCPKRASKCPKSFTGIPPVILVSLDGFHPSFMHTGFTPTIKNIAECGVHAPYMIPVFPSKTFPNHFSQVTGVYPSVHGIIDNTFYDPIKHKLFKVGQPESLDPSWWLKEPIWVTAEKYGKKTACYYWPGSEVKINGVMPSYFKKYNSKKSFESRVNQVLAWLDLPSASRPQFLTLYVNQPDNSLHHFGINSKQANEALVMVDRMIERLFSGLQTRNLLNCVNVIIVSDHGMSDVNCKNVINIQSIIDVNNTFSTVGPFGRIRPKGKRNQNFPLRKGTDGHATVRWVIQHYNIRFVVDDTLIQGVVLKRSFVIAILALVSELVSKLSCKNSHMRAYAKENLPIRFHYANNVRIEPIYLDIDSGWTLVTRGVKNSDEGICTGGAHGYDNMFPDMKAIFLAHGPSFKKNVTMQPFINTEIYEMLAELIDVAPNPNNGTKGSMHYILTYPRTLPQQKIHESPPIADVPSEDDEYNSRVSASGCSCPQNKKQQQVKDIVVTKEAYLPFGTPYSPDEHTSLHLLYNDDYISAFHSKFKIPLWTAFTIKEPVNYEPVEVKCWTGDARISQDSTVKCDDYALLENGKFLQHPVYPSGFSSSSDKLAFITNSIAKSLNYSQIIEEPFNQMLNRWVTEKAGEVNVITGPAYNIFANEVKPTSDELRKSYESNGHLLVPTHIFTITTWCSVKSESLKACDSSKLESHGFLLPNYPFPANCESPADFIMKNTARVVEIEKLTGIHFYTEVPTYDAIRLRTMMPTKMWTS